MEALVTGTPVVSHSSALTGAITGTPFAVPVRGGKVTTPITVQFTFASAPGASVYNLMGSLDNVTYFPLNSAAITEAVAFQVLTFLVNVKFIRLDQVSKTNAVLSTGLLMLG